MAVPRADGRALDVGGGGGAKNSVAGYDFPQRVIYEFVPHLPFRVSSMRSLGAFANVLAIESSMDDLAAIAERDPVEFRLAHLTIRGRAKSSKLSSR